MPPRRALPPRRSDAVVASAAAAVPVAEDAGHDAAPPVVVAVAVAQQVGAPQVDNVIDVAALADKVARHQELAVAAHEQQVLPARLEVGDAVPRREDLAAERVRVELQVHALLPQVGPHVPQAPAEALQLGALDARLEHG